jgi:hypothetical protein
VNSTITLSILNDISIDGKKVEEIKDAQTTQQPLGHLGAQAHP